MWIMLSQSCLESVRTALQGPVDPQLIPTYANGAGLPLVLKLSFLAAPGTPSTDHVVKLLGPSPPPQAKQTASSIDIPQAKLCGMHKTERHSQ